MSDCVLHLFSVGWESLLPTNIGSADWENPNTGIAKSETNQDTIRFGFSYLHFEFVLDFEIRISYFPLLWWVRVAVAP